MDGRGHGEEDDDNCLQVVKCSKGYVPSSVSYWVLQVLRSLTCQSSFSRKKSSSSSPGYVPSHSVIAAAAAVVPLLHRSFSRGLLSSGDVRLKVDPVRCFASLCSDNKMKDFYINPLAKVDMAAIEALDEHFNEHLSFDCGSSSFSVDGLSSESRSLSVGDASNDHGHVDDSISSADGSPPLGWPVGRLETSPSKPTIKSQSSAWEEKGQRKKTDVSEIEMMKDKFAKLLLGEDMSGGGKGVCTALAISNAITNLSASIFGELWRLEPLSIERKNMWRREMSWFLSVADHIVELVPSWQKFSDGSRVEVMISKHRSDIQVNLPALRKLDAMLLDCLDSFSETEFWYADQGIVVAEDDGYGVQRLPQRQEEKWWLPIPKVSINGLSETGRRSLQHQRECVNQILKAAKSINSQVLAEMEVPAVYWDALPKSGKTSLGETIYRHISSEYFSAEAVLCTLDLSTEHNVVEMANRIEAAIHVWRNRQRPKLATCKASKHSELNSKTSWGMVKDLVLDGERRDFLAGRAETLLLCLKQKFPALRQSLLDMTKIQYNKDVGQAILESYSRVLESLAFNIIARIDDVLYVDDIAKRALPRSPPAVQTWINSSVRRGFPLNLTVTTPFATPNATPSVSPSPSPSPRRVPNSPFEFGEESKVLSDYYDVLEKDELRIHEKPPSAQESKMWVQLNSLQNRSDGLDLA